MGISVQERIETQMKAALKARDDVRLQTLRMLKSDLRYKQIELGHDLNEDDVIAVLSSAAKKRSEAMEEFRKGGREDLASREHAEFEIIREFLPAQLSQSELEELIANAIKETGASSVKDLGKVMQALMPGIRGRADGKTVNIAVKTKLLEK